jgi:serine/threonine protein kinase
MARLCTACSLPQLLKLLQVLHNAGIVHRDIRPDNLLFIRDSIASGAPERRGKRRRRRCTHRARSAGYALRAAGAVAAEFAAAAESTDTVALSSRPERHRSRDQALPPARR